MMNDTIDSQEIIDELLFTVPETSIGKRLDQVLHDLMPNYSRSRLQKWIENGQLKVNQHVVTTTKKKLNGGEELLLSMLPLPEELAFEPENIPLNIIYEDDDILVINKPVGLVVHPANGNWTGTVLNGLLYHDPNLKSIPRAGIVHRLDKDTSGLMVVAKTLESQNGLVKQLQSRSVKREYLALAYGLFDRKMVTVNQPIGRHQTQRTKMAVTLDGEGKEAITHIYIERLFQEHNVSFIRCQLETGRTHQIRIHCAYIHHPLVGDGTYCHFTANYRHFIPFPRQALHAKKLTLIHPRTEVELAFECDLADDFQELLDKLSNKV